MVSRRRTRRIGEHPEPARVGRVLVVEDEPDVAELLRYNLSKEGYDVLLASNGVDALRLVRQSRPDLILLDLRCPSSTAGRYAGGSSRTLRHAASR